MAEVVAMDTGVTDGVIAAVVGDVVVVAGVVEEEEAVVEVEAAVVVTREGLSLSRPLKL